VHAASFAAAWRCLRFLVILVLVTKISLLSSLTVLAGLAVGSECDQQYSGVSALLM